MTGPVRRGEPNDTARLLVLMNEIRETADMFLDAEPPLRPHNLVDTALCLADHAADPQVVRDHLIYLAGQAVAWTLTFDRQAAAR